MEYVKATFYPSNITGTIPKGATILEAARMLGVPIEGPCGGMGRCGKDIVQVKINNKLNNVLACRTQIETNIEVIIPLHEQDPLKTVEGFSAADVMKGGINSIVGKEVVADSRGCCITKVSLDDKIVSIGDGDTMTKSYGIALDIGTTTLVASLIDLYSGKVLEYASLLNPLVSYGHDVMSRIKYAASWEDGLRAMHRELITGINLLIETLCAKSNVRPENICQLTGAGNTTMQHIFLNREIKGIGEYPYKAEVLDVCTTTAESLGIGIAKYASVTTFPCISAYVGGDIVSGLLVVNPGDTEFPALFLDIGTNGELVLLLNGRIVASSTAAGPCFEGMTISSGMRAAEGAIERVSLEKEPFWGVIGSGTPKGICGSGLLDLVSELVRTGLVNSRGRLQNRNSETAANYKNYLFEKNGKRYFQLAAGVSVTQEDIRQVQLAKAAIRAGVEILFNKCNVKPEDMKTVIVAGAFGYHLKEECLFRTGFFPALKNARIFFVGNSSLEGAIRLLLNKELVNKATHIARTARVVELSHVPEFESTFIREISFPERENK
ncbi:MAG: ASKHA domain-containing protein [Candidatus Loosdrechtia sp.]|uniref:ASKHA domain-containing protein n=1 Tax=Candidatus Loosdrechtia sp. TaxID=3101272 RepID=UPI003A6B65F6|nr:MAG: ASKHA domain-containing protein [Candidatus Jettenia sp. AMX2]